MGSIVQNAYTVAFRLVPVIAGRLVYLRREIQSHDYPFTSFYFILFTSLHVNMSVVVTCIPFLKPIISGIQSGILAGDIRSLATIDSHHLFTRSRTTMGNKVESEGSIALKKMKSLNTKRSAMGLKSESEERMVIRETREVDVRTAASSTPDKSSIVPDFLRS